MVSRIEACKLADWIRRNGYQEIEPLPYAQFTLGHNRLKASTLEQVLQTSRRYTTRTGYLRIIYDIRKTYKAIRSQSDPQRYIDCSPYRLRELFLSYASGVTSYAKTA